MTALGTRPRKALAAGAGVVALALGANSLSSCSPPPTAVARVNAGGPAYTDSGGSSWAADSGFTGGAKYTTAAAIVGTSDQTLYKTEHWGMTAWTTPVPNGTYHVRLLEAEIYYTAPGKRVFSVTAEGIAVATDVDIFARVGANRADEIAFDVKVADSQLTLGFSASVDNAKVAAIEVSMISAPSTTTTAPPSTTATTVAPPTTTTPLPVPTTAFARGVGWYAANTGPTGTLTVSNGNMTLTLANAGLHRDHLEIRGSLDVRQAANVVFDNVRVLGRIQTSDNNFTCNHCEVDASSLPLGDYGAVMDGHYAFLNAHGSPKGAVFYSHLDLVDSWVHSLRPNGANHRDGVLTNGMSSNGSANFIRTWFEAGDTTSLSGEVCIFGDFSETHDVKVDSSVLVDSGSYGAYLGNVPSKPYHNPTRMTFTNNRVGNRWATNNPPGPPGVQYGAVSAWLRGPTNLFANNFYLNGTPIGEP